MDFCTDGCRFELNVVLTRHEGTPLAMVQMAGVVKTSIRNGYWCFGEGCKEAKNVTKGDAEEEGLEPPQAFTRQFSRLLPYH